MRRKIDIALLYEKGHRELDILCLLKVLLEARGIAAEIFQQNTQAYSAVRDYNPKLVALPFCYQNRSNNVFLLSWRKSTFVNLSWEQFFCPGNRIAKTPRGEFPLRHVIHCAWSKTYADLLVDCGVEERNIRIVGSLPLSQYHDRYKSYYTQKENLARQYDLDVNRPWIFFPENYNWAFYGTEMLEQMVQDGQARSDVDKMRDFAIASFEEAMRWCARAANEHGIELILRPRPATRLDVMTQRVTEVVGELPPNFRIIKDLTVKEWVLSSDLVISSYSSTLIDAAIADKGILKLEPIPLLKELEQEWHHLVPHAATYQEFEQYIRSFRDLSTQLPLKEWAFGNLHLREDPMHQLVCLLQNLVGNEAMHPVVASVESTIYGMPETRPSLLHLAYWYKLLMIKRFANSGDAYRLDPSDEYYEDYQMHASIERRCADWQLCLDQETPAGVAAASVR